MSRDRVTMDRIDATAAVPITLASNVLLGARELQEQARRRFELQAAALRTEVARFRLWLDRQHLDPNLIAQLVALGLYAIAALAETWASIRRARQEK
jgi:hypothetical protein